jgi:hypothetical protein
MMAVRRAHAAAMQAAPQTTTPLSGPAASSPGSQEAAQQEALGAGAHPSPASDPSPSPETIVALEQAAALHARAFVPQPLGISMYE